MKTIIGILLLALEVGDAKAQVLNGSDGGGGF